MANAFSTPCAVRAASAAVLLAAGAATLAQTADAMSTTVVSISPPAAKSAAVADREQVVFSGTAKIKSRLSRDPDFGQHRLLLVIDLSGITGLGSPSGVRYVTASQEVLVRPLARAQKLEINFPYSRSADDPLSAVRTGVAAFSLDVDVATGAIMSAAGTITGQ